MFTGNENVRSILREHSPGDPKCDFRQKKTEKNFQDDNDPEFVEKLHLNDQNFQSESNLSQCYIKVVNRTVDDSALFEPLCTKLSSSILNISITEQTKSDISQDSVLNMANTIPKMIIDLDNEEQRQNISIIKNSELDKSVSLNDMPQNNEMMAALVDGLDDQNLQSSEVVHNIVNNTNYNLQSNGQITIDCTSDMNDIKTDQVLDNSSLCDALFNPSINPNIQVENQDIKIKYKSDKEVDNLNKVLQPNENNFDRIFQKEFNFEVNNNYLSAQFTSPEDELIDAVIIPIIDEANYDDSDLSQYNSNYEISDQLESILSSQLNSETVEIIRDSSINVIDDNQNLSIPQLEHHPNEYNSDNINSVLSGYNVTDKNSSDVDYDPKKITHSSTMADDSTEITGLPATFNNKSIGFEDKLTNSSPCASSTQNIIISNSSSIKIPLPSKGSCDNSKLNAESIFITNKETGDVLHKPRWKKIFLYLLSQISNQVTSPY
ncbi:uncharacterized protein LOC141537848 [Cotesia typhae]|uniref:uncharacterized protein LOC141537848 n=2 Tax=Cotesia typhae TaxID=2053667 RepID=UPI003D68489B